MIGLLAALAISAVLVAVVPKLRAKVVPPLREALAGLWSVARNRKKRLELFGGNLGAELIYAISLGATCLAYGVHLNLAEVVFVNTSASLLSSLIPVPGGIGAAEALEAPETEHSNRSSNGNAGSHGGGKGKHKGG